jgi:ParB-like chromosome segregation protein Spo0J
MKIVEIEIEKLNPARYNPRKNLKPGDPQYESLKKSIEEFDYIDPVIWNERSGNIVSGHQRFKILKDRGDSHIQVSVVDLDDNKEKLLNIAMNKISGEWDFPLLKDLIAEIDTGLMDISITGFGTDELKKLFDYDVKDNIKDVNYEKPPVKMVWVLMGIPLENMIDVQETLTKIQGTTGVIYEQTAR